MRTRPTPRNFSSGELAPWIDGIQNDLTRQGCRTIENWIVMKQGQATRRPGNYYVHEVKDSSKATAILPVVIDDTHRYVLELGDAYVRFYDQATHAILGAPYEVTSPWSTGDLSTLCMQYAPKEKAVYITHHAHPMQKLAWTSDTSWSLGSATVLNTDLLLMFLNGYIQRSKDNGTWTKVATPQRNQPVFFERVIKGQNNYIACTAYTSTGTIWISNDGDAWVETTPSGAHNLWVLVTNGYGTVVAAGSSGAIYTSYDDGLSWTAVPILYSLACYVAGGYDPVADAFRLFAGRTTGADASSVDGAVSWAYKSPVPGPDTLNFPLDMVNSSGTWIIAGTAASMGYYSGTIWAATGVTGAWSIALNSVTEYFYTVAHSYDGLTHRWISVNQSGVVYTSSVGLNSWIAGTTLGRYVFDLQRVGNKFYAWASDARKLYESYDGATWLSKIIDGAPITPNYGKSISNTTIPALFDQISDYPALITSHEGRTVVAATDGKPSTLFGSASDALNNFALGDLASDAFEYELRGDDNVDIQWIMGGMGGLIVGTRTAEGILVGSPDEGITPLTAQFRWLSTFGSSNIQPVRIHDTIVFVQRGGEIIRGYVPASNAYQSPDLTAYADHIAEGGVLELDRQDDPQSMVYARRTDGQLLALTFDNNMRAWSRIKAAPSAAAAAVIESVAIIPTSGAEDEIWQITKRTIGGATKRYVEYYAPLAVSSFAGAHYLDCGLEKTSGTTFAVIGGLTHLAGENVDALIGTPAANARWIQALTVAASGTINIAPYSGTDVHVGLPYSSYLQTMRGDYGSPWGTGAGLNKKTSKIMAWVHDSSALARFGPVQSMTLGTTGEQIVYSASGALMTEMCEINFPGGYDKDNYIWIAVHDPRPFTLVAMLTDSETGDH